jgi:hypothetical protein
VKESFTENLAVGAPSGWTRSQHCPSRDATPAVSARQNVARLAIVRDNYLSVEYGCRLRKC